MLVADCEPVVLAVDTDVAEPDRDVVGVLVAVGVAVAVVDDDGDWVPVFDCVRGIDGVGDHVRDEVAVAVFDDVPVVVAVIENVLVCVPVCVGVALVVDVPLEVGVGVEAG